MRKHQLKLTKFIMGALLVLPLWVTGQNIVWEQTYSIPENQSIVGIAESDTGYLALGRGRSNFVNFSEVLKIDTAGQLLWRKAVFTDSDITTSSSFHMAKVPRENSYYLSGIFKRTIGGTRDYVVKINSVGDTLWFFSYEPIAIFRTTTKLSVLKDKSVLTVGFQQQAGPQDDIFVRRLDSLGNLMWEKIYALPGNQRSYDITEMMDGSLIVSGSSDGDNLLLRIGFDGRLIDTLTFTGARNAIDHQSVSCLPGNFLLYLADSWNGSWYDGQKVVLDNDLNFLSNVLVDEAFIDDPIINTDTTYYLENYPQQDSMFLNNYDLQNNTMSTFTFPINGSIRQMNAFIHLSNSDIILAGLNNDDYWISKLTGTKAKWIPDPCVYSPPVAGFAYDLNGGILTLQDTSYAGLKYLDTIYTWQWTFGNGMLDITESPVTLWDTVSAPTLDVELIVSNWYGCKDTLQTTLIANPVGTGIIAMNQFEEKVWPNPARDVLNISLSEKPGQSVLFEVFDVHGRVQKTMSFDGTEATINISSLPQGIYFYKLSAGGVVKRGKVVKG